MSGYDPGARVEFWTLTGDRYTATGRVNRADLVGGVVVGEKGKDGRIPVRTLSGRLTRRWPEELTLRSWGPQ